MGRFFRVSPTEVQSQFVEMPLDFMYGQLQAKQQEYDQASALNESLKGLLDVEVDPRYDVPTLMKKQEEYNAMIDEAAKNLERTGDVNSALYGVQDIKRKIAKDPFLKYAPEYYKQIQKDQEDYQKGLAEGNVAEYNQNFNDYYYSGNKWKGTVDDKGNLQQYTPGTLYYKNAEHSKFANELMGTIIPDSIDWRKSSYDGNAFKITKAGGTEAVTEKEVWDLAKIKAPQLIQDPTVGPDFIRKMQYKYGDKLTQDILVAEAEQLLFDVTAEQIHNKQKSESGMDFDAAYKADVEANRPVELTESYTPISENNTAAQTAKNVVKHVEDNYSFDEKTGDMVSKTMSDAERKVYEREKEQVEQYGRDRFATLWGQDALVAFDRKDQLAKSDNQKMEGFKKIRHMVELFEPELKNKSDKEVFNLWTNGVKNMAETGSYQKNYGTDYAETLRTQVVSDLPSKKIVMIGGKHSNSSKIFTGKDLETNVKIKTSSGKEKKLSELTQDELVEALAFSGEMAGAFDNGGVSDSYYTATINTTEGPIKVGIEMNNQQKEMYAVTNKVASKVVKGDIGYFNNNFANNVTEKVAKYYKDDNGNTQKTYEEVIPILHVTDEGGGSAAPGYIPVFKGSDGKVKAYGIDKKTGQYYPVTWDNTVSDEKKADMIRKGEVDIYDQKELNEQQFQNYQNSDYMLNNGRKWTTNKIEGNIK